MAKKAAESTRNPIPFTKIAKLYTDGKSMEAIAKAVGRYNEEYDDPTKSVRAIISGMITKGYKNEAGRVVKLKKRARTAKPQPPAKRQTAPKPSNPTPKPKKAVKRTQKAKTFTSKRLGKVTVPENEPVPELVKA